MLNTVSKYDRIKYFTKKEKLVREITFYTQNRFLPDNKFLFLKKLEDEPQVADWTRYIQSANSDSVYAVLKKHLVQFQFPIRKGISQTTTYRQATLKGTDTSNLPSATGLQLEEPENLQLFLHPSPAGKIPVLIAENRADFKAIVQALVFKNEPHPLPDSMGASMIKGLNNWDRLRRARLGTPHGLSLNILANKALYQDRIIVLGKTPYSNVPALTLNLQEDQWLDYSLQIRLAHECAHYFTLRQFGVMSNNMHDELIADYYGICKVKKHFTAKWFLHFIGLEHYPLFRTSGRMKNYLGKPPLSPDAFKVLQTIMKKAAEQVERFDRTISKRKEDEHRIFRLLCLCQLDLTEIASDDGFEVLSNTYDNIYRNQ